MKHILLISFIIISQVAFGQRTCNNPLSNYDFQQKKRIVTGEFNQEKKLQNAIDIAQNNCLMVSQVKELASLLSDDFRKYQFAKEAYANTFDRDNFYEVYDVFARFSGAIRLYDYVNHNENIPSNTPSQPNTNTPSQNQNPIYPNWSYPSYAGYNGKKGCNTPIADSDFDFFAKRVVNLNNEQQKYNSAMSMISSNCLSTAQAMKLASLVSLESNRLNLLQSAYAKVYDQDNFSSATQAFSHQPNKNALLAFIGQQNPINEQPVVVNCEVSDSEMALITKTLKEESFDSKRIELAKNVVKNYECFKITQVRSILKLFSFEDGRLNVAKFMYDYTAPEERKNYHSLTSEFSFSNNKSELLNYINKK